MFAPRTRSEFLNSAGINLNWRRTSLRKKEKQLSSQYDKYFGRVIIFRKNIIFEQENILKSDSIFLLRQDQKMLCISVFMFFESVQANFLPGHFWSTGRRIHNSRSYVFYVFYISMFAYERGKINSTDRNCTAATIQFPLTHPSMECHITMPQSLRLNRYHTIAAL